MKTLIEKYSKQFNANSTVVIVAETLIVNELSLTAVQMAELVQMIFEVYGIKRETTAACISWYKNDMKKKNSTSKIKIEFKNYLLGLVKKDREKILLELALKHQDILIKQLNPEEMQIPEKV